MYAVSAFFDTELGERQFESPEFFAYIGPCVHVRLSELDMDKKNGWPSGSATVQVIGFMFLLSIVTGGCKLGDTVSVNGGAPVFGVTEISEH